jgi:hypothetical protein
VLETCKKHADTQDSTTIPLQNTPQKTFYTHTGRQARCLSVSSGKGLSLNCPLFVPPTSTFQVSRCAPSCVSPLIPSYNKFLHWLGEGRCAARLETNATQQATYAHRPKIMGLRRKDDALAQGRRALKIRPLSIRCRNLTSSWCFHG